MLESDRDHDFASAIDVAVLAVDLDAGEPLSERSTLLRRAGSRRRPIPSHARHRASQLPRLWRPLSEPGPAEAASFLPGRPRHPEHDDVQSSPHSSRAEDRVSRRAPGAPSWRSPHLRPAHRSATARTRKAVHFTPGQGTRLFRAVLRWHPRTCLLTLVMAPHDSRRQAPEVYLGRGYPPALVGRCLASSGFSVRGCHTAGSDPLTRVVMVARRS